MIKSGQELNNELLCMEYVDNSLSDNEFNRGFDDDSNDTKFFSLFNPFSHQLKPTSKLKFFLLSI